MATRSNIGIVNEDGSVTGIYCHWDGYPEHNGKLLLKYYNTTGIVYELMDLGDLSSLNENLYCDDNNHSFENEVDGCTTSQHTIALYMKDNSEKPAHHQHIIKTSWHNARSNNLPTNHIHNSIA